MLLYLVRHAKSSWGKHGLADHQRPLNNRGRRDAPAMFARLAEHGTIPEVVVSSDAVRAATTAQFLLETLGIESEHCRFEPKLYHAGVDTITAVARALPDSAKSAALVGHNPGMTYAANFLAENLELDNLPTCGIVGIKFDCARWADIDRGLLAWFDYPKNPDGPLIRNPTSP